MRDDRLFFSVVLAAHELQVNELREVAAETLERAVMSAKTPSEVVQSRVCVFQTIIWKQVCALFGKTPFDEKEAANIACEQCWRAEYELPRRCDLRMSTEDECQPGADAGVVYRLAPGFSATDAHVLGRVYAR